MPPQYTPETTKQGSATAKPAPTLVPMLSAAGRGRLTSALRGGGAGFSVLPQRAPYSGDASTRPGVVPPGQGIPQVTPQDIGQPDARGVPPAVVGAGFLLGAFGGVLLGGIGGFILAKVLK